MVKCPRCLCENEDNNKYCIQCNYPLNSKKKVTSNDDSLISKWKNMSAGRKVVFALFILFLIVLAFNIVYFLSSSSNDGSDIVTTNKSSIYTASKPYQVNIIYEGSWEGQIGLLGQESSVYGKGNELKFLNAAPWDNVTAFVQKTDDTDKKLTIQLLKNNVVIKENSTTSPNGKVSLTN